MPEEDSAVSAKKSSDRVDKQLPDHSSELGSVSSQAQLCEGGRIMGRSFRFFCAVAILGALIGLEGRAQTTMTCFPFGDDGWGATPNGFSH